MLWDLFMKNEEVTARTRISWDFLTDEKDIAIYIPLLALAILLLKGCGMEPRIAPKRATGPESRFGAGPDEPGGESWDSSLCSPATGM